MNNRGSYGQDSTSQYNPQRVSASRNSFGQNNDQQFSQRPLSKYESIYLDDQNQRKESISPNKQTTIISKPIEGKTVDDKKKFLRRVKYINQLALMDYEEKSDQIYTKYSKVSKETVLKKIKAKNQIAEFIDEEDGEDAGFDELIQFKYGKDKSQGFHFQAQQTKEYSFCPLCDSIHNDHPQVHKQVCERKRSQQPELYSPYSQIYVSSSLERIYKVVSQIKSVEFENLAALMIRSGQQMKNSKRETQMQKMKTDLAELTSLNAQDPIFLSITNKIKSLLKIS